DDRTAEPGELAVEALDDCVHPALLALALLIRADTGPVLDQVEAADAREIGRPGEAGVEGAVVGQDDRWVAARRRTREERGTVLQVVHRSQPVREQPGGVGLDAE